MDEIKENPVVDELKQHPDVSELIDILDKNGMKKEKEEVVSLIDFIGDMEKTMGSMLKELQGMREEINLIHNSSLKVKCQNLVQKTEDKIKHALSVVVKIKDNFIKACSNAVKTFKEKGKEAFSKALRAMKVPETLDILGKLFGKLSKEVKQDAVQLTSMQTELNSAKGHLKNVGRLLIGRNVKEADPEKADKGIISKFGKLLNKIGNGFGSFSQKAMDKADKIRVNNIKESVKNTLDDLKSIKKEPVKTDKPLER